MRFTSKGTLIPYAEYLFTSSTVHNLKTGTSIDGNIPSLDLFSFTIDSEATQLRSFQYDQAENLQGETTVSIAP